MPDAPLTSLTLTEVSARIAARAMTASELTEAYLARIAATEPLLNAYTTVTADRARADAERADQALHSGLWRGPLHGVPVGLKDLFDTAGIRTTAGSALWRNRVPEHDSTVAARLAKAGAVLLGKHATHEFAWGGTTNNPHFGATHNPHDLSRIPGGSSGGGAASVAAHSALAAIGTDTCGSVRIPAALSGCVGIKPSYGQIDMTGTRSLAPSLDHIGPIARTVEDAATLLSVLLDTPPCNSASRLAAAAASSAEDLRVGRLRGYFEHILDPDVRRALDVSCAQLADQGARLVDIDIPDPAHLVDKVFVLVQAEAAPSLQDAFARRPDCFGPDVAAHLRRPTPTQDDTNEARKALEPTVSLLRQALTQCDVLISATEPGVAPLIGDESPEVGGKTLAIEWFLTRLTSIFNIARLPALSVPIGTNPDGLPIGAQVIARDHKEHTLITVGAAIQVTVCTVL